MHVLDEWRAGRKHTLLDEDAQQILDMLGRWGWTWADLDQARGDRSFKGGVVRKSNRELQSEIRKILIRQRKWRQGLDLRPVIRTAKRGKGGGAGSISRTAKWLHRAMVRPGCFTVHPRCTSLIEALTRWCWADDEHKDIIDALRYAVWTQALQYQRQDGTTPAPRWGPGPRV